MTRQTYRIRRFQEPVNDAELKRILDSIPPRQFSEITRLLYKAWKGETEQIRARAQAQLDAMDV